MEIGPYHGTPVAEIIVKVFIVEEELLTKLTRALWIQCPGLPHGENEGKEANFGQGILALGQLSANFNPERPIKNIFLDSSTVTIHYRSCLFYEIA